MTANIYRNQVLLLLSVLPEVAKEGAFALHGGTALNLFVRNMPRLSVDIDLTYLPIENRETTLKNIGLALERIKTNIEKAVPGVKVEHQQEIGKLQISIPGAAIKLEANLVKRGVLSSPIKMQLCEKAQNEFEAFSAIEVVPLGQLYGGKICAALDRQNPRDIFDIKYLLSNEGFTDEIKEGFLLNLLSSARPMNELLTPKFQDQKLAMENQFTGMSEEPFTYEEYEQVRIELVSTIHKSLNDQDKKFLLSVKNFTPDWSIYDFERFPSVAWKLHNLKTLKDNNPEKHEKQYQDLKKKLEEI